MTGYADLIIPFLLGRFVQNLPERRYRVPVPVTDLTNRGMFEPATVFREWFVRMMAAMRQLW